MKKVSKIVLCLTLALACVLSFAACGENADNGPTKTAGVGTAIYTKLGHGNCIAEATVVVDGNGNAIKVTLDDIFSLNDVNKYTDLDANAPKVTVGSNSYYEYVQIGDAVFQANTEGKYNQIGVESGAIEDFWAYYTNADSDAGRQMYYDAFLAKKLNVLTPVAEGTAGAVQLAGSYYKTKAFNTSNGSMRKRYSRYWSTLGTGTIGQPSGLGFNGNMEKLENYLLGNGFSGISENLKKTDLTAGAGGALTLNGVNTGATASDSYMYLIAAYKAYNNALANRKDIK